jgi:ankyrin repeat protein
LLLWLITKDKKPEPPSDIVHLIIAQGVDVNAADDEGETALLWAAEYCFTSDVTEILKANGLDKNRRILSGPTRGWTALDFADTCHDSNMVSVLTHAGVKRGGN